MVKHGLNTRSREVRDMLIEQLNILGERAFEVQWDMSARSVRNWRKLKSVAGTTQPRFSHMGQPHKLSAKEIHRMEQRLIRNPFMTNEELAAVVKNKITPQQAGNIINQSAQGFRWMLEQEDVEKSFTKENYEAGRKFVNSIRNIPLAKRVYVDETRISAKVRRRRGRFPKGTFPHTAKNVKYAGHVIVSAIKAKAWLHPGKVYMKGGLTTEEFEEYVKSDLAPLLEEDDVVFWDRWGRSGRAKKPTAHHFSPKARKYVEDSGASLKLLPPTGKHLDPIEPLFGDVKRIYWKKLSALTTRIPPSKVTFQLKKKLWREAELAIKPASFKRAYKERANGQEFFRVAREKGLAD
jgi:hypothetical protein